MNDWNAYQQSLYNQGYYWPQPTTYGQTQQNSYHHHSGGHKGKENCKHKTNHQQHVEEKKKKDEIVVTTTSTTTKKPPIIEIDINWPSKKKPSHVTDKLHSHEVALTNVFNDTIDKVADQVDKAFTAIKELVDKTVEQVDDKTGHVQQQLTDESYNLVDKFKKKIKKIEKYFQRFKGIGKRIDVEGENDSDEELIEQTDDAIESTLDESKVTMNNSKDKESRSMKFDNNELRYDIKSSISDALKSTHERFDKLVDEQFEKINKKIADVGGKWDAALDKFYSTVEKLKFTGSSSSTSKPLIDESTKVIDWKPKPTTPLPVIPFDPKSTTPEYFKYTIPSIKYRKEENLDGEVDSIMSDLKRIDNVNDDDEYQKSANPAESAKVDELIDSEVEEEENGKTEIVDESSKSVDDLQTEIVANVKDSLKMANDDDEVTAPSTEFDEAEEGKDSTTIILSSSEDEINEDEGKPTDWISRKRWCDTFSTEKQKTLFHPHHVTFNGVEINSHFLQCLKLKLILCFHSWHNYRRFVIGRL